MFNKVLVFTFAMLIGISWAGDLLVMETTDPVILLMVKPPTKQATGSMIKKAQVLNCSSLTGDTIEITDTEFSATEGPCKIRASRIVFRNNVFYFDKQDFDLAAENIELIDNVFMGDLQDHRIIGNNIKLTRNVYHSEHQIYEVAGFTILEQDNVHDSFYQILKVRGLVVKEARNIYAGDHVDFDIMRPITEDDHKEYSADLPTFPKPFYQPSIYIGRDSTYGTPSNEVHFPQENFTQYLDYVLSGSGIHRLPTSSIYRQVHNLYNY